jgi:hypothetical protein
MNEFDDFQKFKKEYEEQEQKDLEKSEEKIALESAGYQERLNMVKEAKEKKNEERTRSIQGLTGEPAPETDLIEDENNIEPPGQSTISTELLAAIAEANNLRDPDEREKAIADINKNFRDEIKKMASTNLGNNQGVRFTDPGDGKEYTINSVYDAYKTK